MENKKEKKPEKDEAEYKEPRPNRILVAMKRLPNGAFVKVEQLENKNIKLTVGNAERSESLALSPIVAKGVIDLLSTIE